MSPSFPSPSPSPNVSVPNRPPTQCSEFSVINRDLGFFFENFSVLFLISIFLTSFFIYFLLFFSWKFLVFFFSKIRSLIFFPQKFFSIFKNFFRFFFLFFWFFLGFLVFFVFVPWPWPPRLRPVTDPSPFFRKPSLLRPPCVPRVKRSFSVPKRSLIYDA